jgi:hypothetical protein
MSMDALVMRILAPANTPCGRDLPMFFGGRKMQWLLAAASMFFLVGAGIAPIAAARYRTTNFIVDAPTPRLAKRFGDKAEYWRREQSMQWLGKELPPWSRPCPIKARVSSRMGAGGATSFVFNEGEVFGWEMEIQGSEQRILDSVLPHEITHTIFASHFRRPLPRWADEGACTTVEHTSEVSKQETMLIEFLQTRRGIPFSVMFAMKEYPDDVLPLYAQGHSLAKFLILQRGKRYFLNFLKDGLESDNWPQAIRKAYGYQDLLVLQNTWLHWIRDGRPNIGSSAATLVASNGQSVRDESTWSRSNSAAGGRDSGGQEAGTLAPRGPYHVGSRAMQGAPSAILPVSTNSTGPPNRGMPDAASSIDRPAADSASRMIQQDGGQGAWTAITRSDTNLPAAKAALHHQDTHPVDPANRAVTSTCPVTWPPRDGATSGNARARTTKSVYDASIPQAQAWR